jgi:hypothetical protein
MDGQDTLDLNRIREERIRRAEEEAARLRRLFEPELQQGLGENWLLRSLLHRPVPLKPVPETVPPGAEG